ncbi:MAG TPA: hypothetical protein GX531_07055 [Methanothermobacter sp.]|nr:hypothetical protein [Methanothermobacter sp.]
MNSKERVLKALKLEQPDIIPYGEYAIDFDTVEKILGHETYLRAKAKSKIAFWEGRRNEVVQSWKEDIVELYTKLDCIDIVNLAAEASGLVPPADYQPDPPKKIADNTWQDSEGRIYKYSHVTNDITMIYDPKKWQREYILADFMVEPKVEKPDESIFEVIDYIIAKLGSQKFIIGPAGNEVGMVLLGGMDRGLIEFVENPEVVKAAGQQLVIVGNIEDRYYIRKGIDAVMWGQDFAYNSGPMVSPKMFEELVLPNCKARVKHVKENFNLPVIKHACGNNWLLMDFFVDIGYDCYQSIQASAGMDIKKLKEKYGKKICLWGGYSYENLVSGTKEDIKKDIEYAVRNAARDGGFILGSSHSVGVGVQYDLFMTVLEEVDRLRNCSL